MKISRPVPTYFKALSIGLCGKDILYRRITASVLYLTDFTFYLLGPPGWPKLRMDISRVQMVRIAHIFDDY